MKQQQGFTLIELIIVIVILGILAVTAAPRFIDIQSDARKETLQGVRAALQGASQLVYAKAAIKGVQTSDDAQIKIGSDDINVRFGYPDAIDIQAVSPENAALEIRKFVDVELGPITGQTTELSYSAAATDTSKFRIKFSSIEISTDGTSGCYIEYTNPIAAGDTPTFSVIDNDC